MLLMNEQNKVSTRTINKWFYTICSTLLFTSIFLWACGDFYIGKNIEEIEKEIYEDIFIVDSLIRTIKLLRGDSTEIYNNEKIFIQQIDQRSNNGSKTEVRGSN